MSEKCVKQITMSYIEKYLYGKQGKTNNVCIHQRYWNFLYRDIKKPIDLLDKQDQCFTQMILRKPQ